MQPKKKGMETPIVYGIFLILVLFIALHGAVAYKIAQSMVAVGELEKTKTALTVINLLCDRIATHPTEIIINEYTKQWLLWGGFGWLIVVLMLESNHKNFIQGKEFGTAKWGTLSDINRFVVFNVRDLGDQLRQIALIIVFDFIWNRMIQNKNSGVRTYCYCDEIHVMFQSYYSANFLKQLYKRGRKYGMCITGLTQNVEDLLRSEQARGMISNSDFIMMLNQSSEDLKILAGMLNISETQMGYVTGADAGSGLLFAEKVIVPFVDRFPETSYLYKLMSTRFGEDLDEGELDKEIANIMKNNTTDAPMSDKEIEQKLQMMYNS